MLVLALCLPGFLIGQALLIPAKRIVLHSLGGGTWNEAVEMSLHSALWAGLGLPLVLFVLPIPFMLVASGGASASVYDRAVTLLNGLTGGFFLNDRPRWNYVLAWSACCFWLLVIFAWMVRLDAQWATSHGYGLQVSRAVMLCRLAAANAVACFWIPLVIAWTLKVWFFSAMDTDP